jgi:RNA polymerase sigma factor (sigma-70 family)
VSFPDHRTTDEALLDATPQDAEAFALFYRRHAPSVLGYLMRRVGNAEIAADVCAEAFAAALVGAERFDPRSGQATAWLYGIVRHKLLDAQRRGRAEDRARRRLGIPRLELTDDALERVEALASLTATPLAEAMDELPSRQRSAIRSRVVHEQSYGEIAVEQGTTEANVRQRVTRGLARLRRHIEETS